MSHFFVPRSKEDVAALGYLAGWKIFGLLPERMAYGLGNFAADRVAKNPSTTRQLRKNLARVMGCHPDEVPQGLIRASMRSYLRYWVEAFRLPTIASPELAAEVQATSIGLAELTEQIEAGKSVVIPLPHCGNWDMAGMWLVDRSGQFATVAERLKPEVLYDAFVEYRESLGFKILPLTGGQPAMPQLKERLEQGGVVCLLSDRDFGGRGVPVTFFGEETTMPVGAAKLAQETGALLVPAGLSYIRDGWRFVAHPPVPTENRSLNDIVQDVANIFESDIAQHPADWHMMQPLWPADRKRK
ncbi:MAG: phosphatidylinositol mannoside acyltransferase [Corynebacterium sp.]|uniref:phosphatidylinositol mannoside acyltransferase n=1 Tax=Corynebacterium sp. TaxID=1720 RepID=UPI0026DCEA38|nr:phosphatidylinositol mannoside acyltransferase [Corynebacterium sp.]MDO5029165.1 phosphatidylinositol mannoside acyltransferase [Corynebacterium sp.]